MVSIKYLVKLAEQYEEVVRTHRSGELPYVQDEDIFIPVTDAGPPDEFLQNARRVGDSCALIQRLAREVSLEANTLDEDRILTEEMGNMLAEMAKELFAARQAFRHLHMLAVKKPTS